jgi:hypothetical protein
MFLWKLKACVLTELAFDHGFGVPFDCGFYSRLETLSLPWSTLLLGWVPFILFR